MEVLVDHDRMALEGNPQNLMEAVGAASEYLKARGRAILSILADGQSIPPHDLEAQGVRLLEGIGRLEIVSEDVGVLVNQALRELEEVLPELPKACHDLAAVFQGSNPTEGYDPFQQLAGIWGAVKSRELQIAELIGYSLENTLIQGVPAKRLHEELNGFLEEAASALQAGDCVLLGDLLEYELAPRAEAERQLVAALRQSIDKSAVNA